MGQLAFSDVEIRELGPDAAIALGRFTLSETRHAGGGTFTLVFLRTEKGWRIVHDHSSADADRAVDRTSSSRTAARLDARPCRSPVDASVVCAGVERVGPS